MSQGNTPSTPVAGGAPVLPTEPKHPVQAVCSRVFDAFKGGNNCEVLQAFDELQALDLEAFPEFKGDVLRAWGRGIIAAAQMCSDDEEHLNEMVDDYECRFNQPSAYLRVMLAEGSNASCALSKFLEEHPPPLVSPPQEELAPKADDEAAVLGTVTLAGTPQAKPEPPLNAKYFNEALEGILEKFRSSSCEDSEQLVQIAKRLNFDKYLTTDLIEKMQRPFIQRMKSKTEDVEVVFDQMLAAGLPPVNSVPFTFIFMKPQLSKPIIDHYYMMMLEHGIKPVESAYRILLRNPMLNKDEHYFIRKRISGANAMEDNDYYDRKLSVFRGLGGDNVYDEAVKLFNAMLVDGVIPTKHAFNRMISMSKSNPAMAEAYYRKMIELGVQPNALTFTTLISVWRHYKLADSVERWIAEMNARGMQLDVANYSALLDGYVKSNSRGKAQNCFKALLSRGDCNMAVYNSVMSLGPFDFAFGCLAAMLSDGLSPNAQSRETLVSMAKDDISNSLIDELAACSWNKDKILCNTTLTNPPKGTTPSLHDCMRLLMREMKLSDEDIKKRSELLTAEIDLAKRK